MQGADELQLGASAEASSGQEKRRQAAALQAALGWRDDLGQYRQTRFVDSCVSRC